MKSLKGWGQWLVGAILVCIAVAILFPVGRSGYGSRRSTCQSNLKQIAIACRQYLQDYDGTFPPISTQDNQGWADGLFIYTRSWGIFQCPEGEDPPVEQRTDYFYNAQLAEVSKPIQRERIILFGEGYDNSGTNAHLSELPFDWKSDETSPEKRHLDGANYAFADGHVKWMRYGRLTQSPNDGNLGFTFEVNRSQ